MKTLLRFSTYDNNNKKSPIKDEDIAHYAKLLAQTVPKEYFDPTIFQLSGASAECPSSLSHMTDSLFWIFNWMFCVL